MCLHVTTERETLKQQRVPSHYMIVACRQDTQVSASLATCLLTYHIRMVLADLLVRSMGRQAAFL